MVACTQTWTWRMSWDSYIWSKENRKWSEYHTKLSLGRGDLKAHARVAHFLQKGDTTSIKAISPNNATLCELISVNYIQITTYALFYLSKTKSKLQQTMQFEWWYILMWSKIITVLSSIIRYYRLMTLLWKVGIAGKTIILLVQLLYEFKSIVNIKCDTLKWKWCILCSIETGLGRVRDLCLSEEANST